jgi:TRAP transporter TAXI family solute receptor
MIAREQVEMAIGDAGVAYRAYNQLGEFAAPEFAKLRAFTPGANFGQAFIVRADSPFNTIEDLAGQRVALGPPGTSTAAVGQLTLEYYGIGLDDIRAEFLTFGDATSALSDRALDAIYMTSILAPGNIQYAALSELTVNTSVRFIVPEGEPLERMRVEHPYLARVTLPADFYGPGVPDRDLDVAGFFAMTYIHADVDADVAYDMVKVLFENQDALAAYHPLAPAYASPDFIDAVPIPFHDGVQRYFRERGWID